MRTRRSNRRMLKFPLSIMMSAMALGMMSTSISAQEATHTVQAGEYLYSIANQYGVTVNQLKEWNNLTDESLQINDVLVVSAEASTPETTPETSETPEPMPENPETPAPEIPTTDTQTTSEVDYSTGTVVVYTVKPGEHLSLIARRYGVTANELRLWNHLTSDVLQVGQELKIIPGTVAEPEVPVNPNPSDPDDHSGEVTTYLVKAGDTLWSIASRFGVTVNNLRLWNHLTTDFLSIGQELKMIPPTTPPTNPAEPTDPDDQSGDVTTYIIKAGDTLWGIASRYGVTVNNLRLWNHLTTDILQIGMELKLIPTTPTHPPVDPEQPITTYIVKSGDSLWAIGNRFGVTVNQLKTWNNLTTNFLSIGQQLTLKAPMTPPPATDTTYTVQSGDTLWSIGNRYGVTVSQLKTWNSLTSNHLSIGMRLKVEGEVAPTPPPTTLYTVKAGDTLWSIGTRYGVTVAQLKQWNSLTSNFLSIGQRLNVTATRTTYTVKPGDSLWKIATQFGVTIENLKDWNGLTTNVIYANQRLIVK